MVWNTKRIDWFGVGLWFFEEMVFAINSLAWDVPSHLKEGGKIIKKNELAL